MAGKYGCAVGDPIISILTEETSYAKEVCFVMFLNAINQFHIFKYSVASLLTLWRSDNLLNKHLFILIFARGTWFSCYLLVFYLCFEQMNVFLFKIFI